MKKYRLFMATIMLGMVSTAVLPLRGAEEPGLTPNPSRPPISSPRNNKPIPTPNSKPAPSASPAQKNGTTSNSKPKWEYMIVAEGMNFVVDGKNNGALEAKMALMGVNGWELAAVHSEGGQKVFIYKRQL